MINAVLDSVLEKKWSGLSRIFTDASRMMIDGPGSVKISMFFENLNIYEEYTLGGRMNVTC